MNGMCFGDQCRTDTFPRQIGLYEVIKCNNILQFIRDVFCLNAAEWKYLVIN